MYANKSSTEQIYYKAWKSNRIAIERKDKEYAAKINQFEDDLRQERSSWKDMLEKVYSFANQFGLKDPMIEYLLQKDDAA